MRNNHDRASPQSAEAFKMSYLVIQVECYNN